MPRADADMNPIATATMSRISANCSSGDIQEPTYMLPSVERPSGSDAQVSATLIEPETDGSGVLGEEAEPATMRIVRMIARGTDLRGLAGLFAQRRRRFDTDEEQRAEHEGGQECAGVGGVWDQDPGRVAGDAALDDDGDAMNAIRDDGEHEDDQLGPHGDLHAAQIYDG